MTSFGCQKNWFFELKEDSEGVDYYVGRYLGGFVRIYGHHFDQAFAALNVFSMNLDKGTLPSLYALVDFHWDKD